MLEFFNSETTQWDYRSHWSDPKKKKNRVVFIAQQWGISRVSDKKKKNSTIIVPKCYFTEFPRGSFFFFVCESYEFSERAESDPKPWFGFIFHLLCVCLISLDWGVLIRRIRVWRWGCTSWPPEGGALCLWGPEQVQPGSHRALTPLFASGKTGLWDWLETGDTLALKAAWLFNEVNHK